MNRNLAIGSIVVSVIGIVLLLAKGCRQAAMLPSTVLTLAPNEDAHTRVGGAQIETLERTEDGKEIERIIEPNYHHGVDFEIKKDGTINTVVKTHGFSTAFGLSTDFYRIGGAWEPYFWHDFHGLIGFHFFNLRTDKLNLNAYGALAYRLPFTAVNNFSTYIGYDTDRHIVGGVFLRFGSV